MVTRFAKLGMLVLGCAAVGEGSEDERLSKDSEATAISVTNKKKLKSNSKEKADVFQETLYDGPFSSVECVNKAIKKYINNECTKENLIKQVDKYIDKNVYDCDKIVVLGNQLLLMGGIEWLERFGNDE